MLDNTMLGGRFIPSDSVIQHVKAALHQGNNWQHVARKIF
jgi:hypothetical protein